MLPDIDDALRPSHGATVEEGLRLLIRLRQQVQALTELKGLGWGGDLDEMRRDRAAGQP